MIEVDFVLFSLCIRICQVLQRQSRNRSQGPVPVCKELALPSGEAHHCACLVSRDSNRAKSCAFEHQNVWYKQQVPKNKSLQEDTSSVGELKADGGVFIKAKGPGPIGIPCQGTEVRTELESITLNSLIIYLSQKIFLEGYPFLSCILIPLNYQTC